jgi:hypothetical protein
MEIDDHYTNYAIAKWGLKKCISTQIIIYFKEFKWVENLTLNEQVHLT